MPLSPARRLAHDVLLAVEDQGGYASDLLHSALSRGMQLDDRRLATEIVLGVLRHRAQLDYAIERAANRPATKIATPALIALRIGVYQLRHLTRIPPNAAVHESVEMVKADAPKLAGFVNAVLRHMSLAPIAALLAAESDLGRRRAIAFNHPQWLLERWSAAYGADAAQAIAEYNNRTPPVAVTLATGCAPPAELDLQAGTLLAAARRVLRGDATRTTAYRTGALRIQDEASQLIAHLLQPAPGDRILDACAAPGSKTLTLRDLAPAACLIALERNPRRADTLRRRVGPTIAVVVADAARPLPLSCSFPRILVDAPCTGTGTLARNPEIRWRLQPGDPARLAHLQFAILRRSAQALAPGGRLVYSVCSLEPEEGPAVVDRLLAAEPGLRRLPASEILDALAANGSLVARPPTRAAGLGDDLLILPGAFASDGFYAAALERG